MRVSPPQNTLADMTQGIVKPYILHAPLNTLKQGATCPKFLRIFLAVGWGFSANPLWAGIPKDHGCRAQVPYFPPLQSIADFPIAECVRLVRAALGLPQAAVTVHDVRMWTMDAKVADKFQVRGIGVI